MTQWDDGTPHTPQLIVFEPEEAPKSGLLDKDGNPIVRMRQPIGFDLTPSNNGDVL